MRWMSTRVSILRPRSFTSFSTAVSLKSRVTRKIRHLDGSEWARGSLSSNYGTPAEGHALPTVRWEVDRPAGTAQHGAGCLFWTTNAERCSVSGCRAHHTIG